MSKKIPYDVSGSSLVNLKAELYRKQEESRRKSENKSSGTVQQGYVAVVNNSLKSKAKSNGKRLEAEKNGSGNKAAAEEEPEDGRSWEKAKAALAAKAKIYDKMASEQYIPEEGEDEHLLVDFSRKLQSGRQFAQQTASRYSPDSNGDSDSDSDTIGPTPLPSNTGEEWTEYEDYLGRSRKCLKKDLATLMAQSEKLRLEMAGHSSADQPSTSTSPPIGPSSGSSFDFGQSPLEDRTLMSEDMRREVERRLWEQEELFGATAPADSSTKGKVPIHYQTVENNEIRNLGVGYFKFSKEEEVRNEEIESLKNLHQQTLNQRSQKDQLKAKRKAVMDARLAKVRERKILKGEPVAELQKEDSDDEFEKLLAAKAPPASFVEDLTPAVKSGPPQTRPWDKGKVNPEFDDKAYNTTRREERNQDFAPPSSYSPGTTDVFSRKQKKRPPPDSPRMNFSDPLSSFEHPQRPGTYEPPVDSSRQPWEHLQPKKKYEEPAVPADPWKNMQPWKERIKDDVTPSTDAQHLKPADEKRPWAFAPPPSMYAEEMSGAKQMTFGRASEDEIREQARKLFTNAQTKMSSFK